MNYPKLEWLLLQYFEARSSEDENMWLMKYFDTEENKTFLKDFIQKELESPDSNKISDDEKYNMENIFEKMMAAIRRANQKRK